MAITRLTDLVTVFESKWVYGDVKFGYDGEVNQDHDTKYPLMLIEPPTSIMPVIYEGREDYEFEINFYNLYPQDSHSLVSLQKRWDNLQDLANEWMDFMLKNYQDSTVEAYLNDESIEIERVKDVANDKLVQIKLTFTMSGFTKCFRPTSKFPTDYSDLIAWLSADSLATFDIPTKKVSLLTNRSGNDDQSVRQTDTTKQPLRIGYDGINDKTYLSFNGTTDNLSSLSLLGLSADDFTIFEVSKFGDVSEVIFSYENPATTGSIRIELDSNDDFLVTNGYGSQEFENTISNSSDIKGAAHIGVVRRDGTTSGSTDTLKVLYYDANNQKTNTESRSTTTASFNASKFYIGSKGGASEFLSGEFNELIIYNRALTDTEIDDVVGYLNYKYKIY
jgi:hypothetical protein